MESNYIRRSDEKVKSVRIDDDRNYSGKLESTMLPTFFFFFFIYLFFFFIPSSHLEFF